MKWPYTDRLPAPPDRLSALQAYQLATLGAHWLLINVVINWQLSQQGIGWPVSPDRMAGSGVDPSRTSIFLKLSADKLLVFKWSQDHYFSFIWNMCLCHYGPALLTLWFQTDLGRENSASYLKMQAGKTDAFHFSHHSHALVTLHVQFLCCIWLVIIWPVSSCGKFMPHLATRLLWQP